MIAFNGDLTVELADHFVDIGQSEAKSFDIMTVAGRDTIEFIKYSFEIFLPDTDPIVFNGDPQTSIR